MSLTPPAAKRRGSSSIRPVLQTSEFSAEELPDEPHSANHRQSSENDPAFLSARQTFGSLKSQPTSGASTPVRSGKRVVTIPADSGVPHFQRTLPSDIEANAAFQLLESLDSKCSLFKEFDRPVDFHSLCELFTFLQFQPGDTIIEAGEESSFIGIVCTGTLTVQIETGKSREIQPGNLLGEISFFQGGIRTAAVFCKIPAILAIITFAELDSLREIAPDFRLKLITLFAVEGIKKLSAFHGKPTTDDENNGANGNYGKSGGAAGAGNSKDPGLSSGKALFEVRKVESLFKSRLKNQERKLEQIKLRATAEKQEIEHKNITMTVIHERHVRELQRRDHQIFSLEQEISTLKRQKKELSKKYSLLQEEYQEEKESLQEWKSRYESLEINRKSLENHFLQISIENRTLQGLQGKMEEKIKENRGNSEELENYEKMIREIKEIHQQEIKQEKALREAGEGQWQQERESYRLEKERLQRDIEILQGKLQESNGHYKEAVMKYEEKRLRLLESEEKYETLTKSYQDREKTIESLERILAVQSRDLKESQKQQKKISHYKFCYSQIIKITSIQNFIKQFRRKKLFLSLLQEFQAMAGNLYENLRGDYEKWSNFSLEPPPVLGKPGNGSASGELSSQDSLGKSGKSSGKPAGRVLLANGQINPNANEMAGKLAENTKFETILEYFLELSPYLGNLIEKVLNQRIYWRISADSFFNRTIQLKQEINRMEKEMTGNSAVPSGNTAVISGTSGTASGGKSSHKAHSGVNLISAADSALHHLPVPNPSLSLDSSSFSLLKYHSKPELEHLDSILEKESEYLQRQRHQLNSAVSHRATEENSPEAPETPRKPLEENSPTPPTSPPSELKLVKRKLRDEKIWNSRLRTQLEATKNRMEQMERWAEFVAATKEKPNNMIENQQKSKETRLTTAPTQSLQLRESAVATAPAVVDEFKESRALTAPWNSSSSDLSSLPGNPRIRTDGFGLFKFTAAAPRPATSIPAPQNDSFNYSNPQSIYMFSHRSAQSAKSSAPPQPQPPHSDRKPHPPSASPATARSPPPRRPPSSASLAASSYSSSSQRRRAFHLSDDF